MDEVLFSIPFDNYYGVEKWQLHLVKDIENYITNSTIPVPILTDKEVWFTEQKKVYQSTYVR